MQRFIQCDGSRENMVGGAEGMTILDVEGWWIPEKMFIYLCNVCTIKIVFGYDPSK